MLAMALELARFDPACRGHRLEVLRALRRTSPTPSTRIGGTGLWNEEDGFYYDQMHVDGRSIPLRVRSIVGLIPLLAVEVLSRRADRRTARLPEAPGLVPHLSPDLARHISYMETAGRPRFQRPPPAGDPLRGRGWSGSSATCWTRTNSSPLTASARLSKYHRDNPYVFRCSEQEYRVEYVPGESDSNFFGGNSNWRGPIWFPVNYLLIEALERYHHFYGDSLKVECPTGSGRWMNLAEVAHELSSRLVKLFLPDQESRRPCRGGTPRAALGPDCDGLLLFHEYFHGETGAGLGASHQTGWTSLVADCLWKMARGRAT